MSPLTASSDRLPFPCSSVPIIIDDNGGRVYLSRHLNKGRTMPETPDPAGTARQQWMAVLARAAAAEIAAGLEAASPLPPYVCLRGPEAGLVMVRGRVGGSGAAFNLGEMTVTRCTVRTEGGLVGHAYITGREFRQAELAAFADALLQDPALNPLLQQALLDPLAGKQAARRESIAAKAAATRVQFFAMRNMRA